MKSKINLVLVCFLVLLTIGSADAVMLKSSDGKGDCLIFPYFDADKENVVSITNHSDDWLQIHVRIRTGDKGLTGLGFPLILLPNDTCSFLITRNGYDDGLWRVVEWQDTDVFQHIKINSAPLLCLFQVSESFKNKFEILVPLDDTTNDFYKRFGYIEIFGTAVFVQGLNGGKCTNAWSYWKIDGGILADVPNVLSGKMSIIDYETETSFDYNAVAISNFRTNTPNSHRVENYVSENGSVIDAGVMVMSENAAINNYSEDDYTYEFYTDMERYKDVNSKWRLGGLYESMISIKDTWGPTLADGDDYLQDRLDMFFGVPTSVREVEEALYLESVSGELNHESILLLPTKNYVLAFPNEFSIIPSWSEWQEIYYGNMKILSPEYQMDIYGIDGNRIAGEQHSLPFELNFLQFSYPSITGKYVLSEFKDEKFEFRRITTDGKIPAIKLDIQWKKPSRLAVSFESQEVYLYDGSSWTGIAGWKAENMIAWGDKLAADFGENGLWLYDGSAWTGIVGWNAENMIAWENKLAADFGENGLWLYDGGSWTGIVRWNSENMIAWEDKLAADFGENGLWLYDGSSWKGIVRWDSENMIAWGDKLAADFGEDGLWLYDGSSWKGIVRWNPENMIAWENKLAVDFGENGLRLYDGNSWKGIVGWNPENMIAWGSDLVADFGKNGLYLYNGSSWETLPPLNSEIKSMTVWKDSWRDDLIVNFGENGLSLYDGYGWTDLKKQDAYDMEIVNLP